jgi:hypothetical protein
LLSGINNEGKNVLFGFGLVKTLDYKNLKWILKQFVDFNKHPVHGKIYPATVISQFEPSLNDAVHKVLSDHSTSLFCQQSMLKSLKTRFTEMEEKYKILTSRQKTDETSKHSKFQVSTHKELMNFLREVVYTEDTQQFQ